LAGQVSFVSERLCNCVYNDRLHSYVSSNCYAIIVTKNCNHAIFGLKTIQVALDNHYSRRAYHTSHFPCSLWEFSQFQKILQTSDFRYN